MSQKFLWTVRVGSAVAVVGMFAAAGVAYAVVPTFSQTSVTVGVGQSTTVAATNGTSVYMGSNSASTVVSVSPSGTQLTLTGLSPGTATLSICGVGTASDCTELNVTVQTGSVSGILFSQTNLSLSSGASQSVTVSGGNGSYTISSNSNTTVVSTNLSGNTLTVSGLASGGATIEVCDTSNTCGSLLVTINASSASSTTGLSFSENNISLAAGGSQIVDVSGGDGAYAISNNSNASIASVGMSGANAVIVDGSTAGSATITVCDNSSIKLCGALYVTVTGSTPSANQAVTFSVTNPTLTVGQSLSVQLSGGAISYVLFSNGNANVVQASVNNATTLALYGASAGTDSLTICATGGGCAPLSVTVTGTGTSSASTATSVATTSATPTTTTPITVPTTTTEPGTAVVNSTLLAEIQALQSAVTQTLNQLQSIQSQLSQIETQVNAGGGISASVSAGNSSGASADFTELLTVGSEDTQVTALQQSLTSFGFYTGPITGYYGTLTEQAVMKYQTAHGIEATGSVGPATRASLNAGN